jgi:hypothetical protein
VAPWRTVMNPTKFLTCDSVEKSRTHVKSLVPGEIFLVASIQIERIAYVIATVSVVDGPAAPDN